MNYQIRILTLTLFFTLSLSSVLVRAEKLEIPDDELAQETVLPVFDRVESVKNRSVITQEKIEAGAYYGWNITEPVMTTQKLGLNLGYHTSSDTAWVLNLGFWMNELNSTYTDSLSSAPNYLNFNRSPMPRYSAFLMWEKMLYYGKISLAKNTIMNMSLYPILGAGVTSYSNKTYLGITGGVGQKYYFGKNWGLRGDLKLQMANQPSPFLRARLREGNPNPSVPDDPKPEASEFKDRWTLNTILDLGLVFLF